MEKDKRLASAECARRCEDRYFRCVSTTYTGCAEVLRVCRDRCPR